MKTKRNLFTEALIVLMMICGLIFTACPSGESEEENEDPFDTRNAAKPVITLQPASSAYLTTDAIAPLTVEATVSDDGVLSYQWYSVTGFENTGGTAISGETSASYTPPATTGESYYYVDVTNTNEKAENIKTRVTPSAPVIIRVYETEPAAPGASVTIDNTTRYQYVRGFGAMSNVWTSPDMQIEDIDSMFSPDKLGLNILRICLYPNMQEVISGNDSSGQTAGIDNSDYYDFVARVNKYGGYVLASPWTMPPEWKTNNSRTGGGHLKAEYYQVYADYLKDYCQDMYDNGAPIYTVSIQNEPNWAATYDGCEWSAEEMRDFFKQVGHFTDGVKGYGGGKEIDTVLTMNGESANTATINDAAIDDPAADANIDIYARHIYGNVQQYYQKAKDKNKEMWMTEHNINSGSAATYPQDSTWNYVWKVLNEVDVCMRLNDMEAFIWWYGKRFYSFIGDGQYGTIEHAILPRGYAFSHYAKFAKESTRVGLTSSGIASINGPSFTSVDNLEVKATAYESDDGNTLSLVIYAPTDATGKNGTDVGALRINLPEGFVAKTAYAMVSNGTKLGADEPVVLNRDKKSADITLPAGTIISVRFTK